MIKNRTGVIIGITSVVALSGNPGQSNYAASKSAMISMYKSIALEVAQRNIRINLIAPGFIQTPMTEKLNNVQIKGMMDKIPMKKLGEPDDVSNLALFLSSNQSSYITGQTFHINGGMLMV
jgi:3-oxoacyl-[acyl-carrier protein] reductase